MPEWTDTATVADEAEAVQQMNELLLESLQDMQRLIQEDVGWQRIGQLGDNLSLEGLKRISSLCRVMSITNPLIKRGLGLRAGYVWGQGVDVSVDDDGEDDSQDVNAIIDDFWNDKRNRKVLTSSQAQERLERQLGTHGEVMLALPVVAGGRVLVRSVPPGEIEKIISDPEDKDSPWYYLRVYNEVDPLSGRTRLRRVAYPALGYWPEKPPPSIKVGGQEYTVRWDAPMRAIQVNVPEGWDRGIPDAFAALRWARASEEFLADWAKMMRALSRVVWQVRTKSDKTQEAARKIASPQPVPGNVSGAGATVGLGPNSTLEAVPKTGATVDANSGRPLQQMVASALGVPLTMLTGDPGATGARAVAETLDQPTEHEMSLRREVWTSAIVDICDFVIDQAILAGRLRGTQTYDPVDKRRIFELPPEDSRTILVKWPEWDSVPLDLMMKAISLADSTDKVPPLVIVKLILQAFGVEDIDEIIDEITDDDGNFIPVDVQTDRVRSRMEDRGEGIQPGAGPDDDTDREV